MNISNTNTCRNISLGEPIYKDLRNTIGDKILDTPTNNHIHIKLNHSLYSSIWFMIRTPISALTNIEI